VRAGQGSLPAMQCTCINIILQAQAWLWFSSHGCHLDWSSFSSVYLQSCRTHNCMHTMGPQPWLRLVFWCCHPIYLPGHPCYMLLYLATSPAYLPPVPPPPPSGTATSGSLMRAAPLTCSSCPPGSHVTWWPSWTSHLSMQACCGPCCCALLTARGRWVRLLRQSCRMRRLTR
jgi:hypothetical protein